MDESSLWVAIARCRLEDAQGIAGRLEAARLGVEPPNQAAYEHALNVLEAAVRADVCATDITISAEEGIGFRFACGDRVAYIECYNTGEMVTATDDRTRDDVQAWDFTPADLTEAVGRVKGFLGG